MNTEEYVKKLEEENKELCCCKKLKKISGEGFLEYRY